MLPFTHFDKVNSALYCMVRGKLCIALTVAFITTLTMHMMLFAILVDHRITSSSSSHIESALNDNGFDSNFMEGRDTPDKHSNEYFKNNVPDIGRGKETYKVQLLMNNDEDEGEATDLVEKVKLSQGVMDTSNGDLSNGGKRILAQAEYEMEQKDKEGIQRHIVNEFKYPDDRPLDDDFSKTTPFAPIEIKIQHQIQIDMDEFQGDTEKQEASVVKKNKILSAWIRRDTKKQNSDSPSLRQQSMDNDLVDLDVLLGKTTPKSVEHSATAKPINLRSIRDVSSQNHHIPAVVVKNLTENGDDSTVSREKEHLHKNLPAQVQEFNIDPLKRDEEWEAQEDMSLEHLIVAAETPQNTVGKKQRRNTKKKQKVVKNVSHPNPLTLAPPHVVKNAGALEAAPVEPQRQRRLPSPRYFNQRHVRLGSNNMEHVSRQVPYQRLDRRSIIQMRNNYLVRHKIPAKYS